MIKQTIIDLAQQAADDMVSNPEQAQGIVDIVFGDELDGVNKEILNVIVDRLLGYIHYDC